MHKDIMHHVLPMRLTFLFNLKLTGSIFAVGKYIVIMKSEW